MAPDVDGKGVRWSNPMCRPGPIWARRVTEMLAKGRVADALFCALLADLHLKLEREVDLDRVVEIMELRFSPF
jgi:hypothetical protein